MPPNLGGFFMVRSYYPSECHADYFDFERIEALKPAIEACGISTRSEERFSRNAETDLVCRLLLEKKNHLQLEIIARLGHLQLIQLERKHIDVQLAADRQHSNSSWS